MKLGISKTNTVDCNNQIVQKCFSEKTHLKQSKIFIRTKPLPVESVQNYQLRIGIKKENSSDGSLEGMNTMSGPLSAVGKYFYYHQNKGH